MFFFCFYYCNLFSPVCARVYVCQVPVAIKTLNQQHLVSGTDGFMREAQVMVRLDHPCIVKLIGICQGPPLMLVSFNVTLAIFDIPVEFCFFN